MRHLAVKNMLEIASEVLFLVLSFLATRKLLNFVEQFHQKVTELYRKYDESLYRRNFWNLEVPTLKNPRRNLQMVKLGSELSSSTFSTVPYGLHPRQASISNAPSVNYQARHFKTVQNSLHLLNSSN